MAAACLLTATGGAAPVASQSATIGTGISQPPPAFPLKVSENRRYLVDQHNVPFMMVGDSPQALIGNVSLADSKEYIENRAKYSINTLWINLVCNSGTACSGSGTTYDGVAPFTTPGDLSTPNTVYFDRADAVIRLAAANGMVVLLDPIETAGWLSVLRANGVAKARAYGEYLGSRYRSFPNIIWLHGNDFQTWRIPFDDAVVKAVAEGIRSVDHVHLHTVELNYLASGSLDDPGWAPLIDLEAAYTYMPTYVQVLAGYNRPQILPTFLIEANYEFEKNYGTDGASVSNLRRQEYWTMLCGATGQLYGNRYTWRFPADWKTKLDTPGVQQLQYMARFFGARRWFDLVPDQDHATVTAGYGRFYRKRHLERIEYVTAARTADGHLLIAYLPAGRTITVDMKRLAGGLTAQWFDPTDGSYRPASYRSVANSDSRDFTPPGRNRAGDTDWILFLSDN